MFHPQWNLTICDTDFYLCQVENPLTIEVTIGELVDEFLQLTNKYGLYLRGWDKSTLQLYDEPNSELEGVLTVRLKVEKNLEPAWYIVSDRNEEGGMVFVSSKTECR